MKQAMIYKGFAPEDLTKGDLEKINRYTRRELSADEVYVFPLILCDNEIDRDFEKFSIEALAKLRRLFMGKTGIFDHNPKGENQTARIFDTAVEKDELRKTATGETYHFLTAKAYMMRSEKNHDLILDIDAGIKKEVSVGCAVAEVICSVCGANAKEKPCEHMSGKMYGDKACHFTLQKPTDAYEWSFVAVPAQPAAGVTKAYTGGEPCTSLEALALKLAFAKQDITLSCEDVHLLSTALEKSLVLARDGDAYRSELKKELLSAVALSGGISVKVVSDIAEKLSTEELRELKKTFMQKAGTAPLPLVQTGSYAVAQQQSSYQKAKLHESNTQFKI